MIWLAISIIVRDAFIGFVLVSSGEGEPEDGVESEGEPGSGGEFITMRVLEEGRWRVGGDKCHIRSRSVTRVLPV